MSWYWWSLSYVEVDLGIEWLNLIDERREYYIKVKCIIWNVKTNRLVKRWN